MQHNRATLLDSRGIRLILHLCESGFKSRSLLLVAVIGAIAWQVLRSHENEPVYQGKRLSVWLRDSSGTPELTNAVTQIGTNGIPTLLKMLRKKDSPSVSKLIDLWDRHIARTPYLPGLVRYPDWYLNQARHVNDSAVRGFKILGADAQQAVPELVKIYEKHDSISVPDDASEALIAVAPDAAIPLFVRDIGSSNQFVRVGAVIALGDVHTAPQRVPPVLARLLNDSNINVRFVAVRSLQHLGTNAQQAVPALFLALGDPTSGIRSAVTNALKQIDPEAAARAGVK